mgnify:CR=1 FL=1
MIYIGIDYHKRYSVATQMDETGKILSQIRLSNDSDTLLGYLRGLPKGTKIALEATGSWYYFYEMAEGMGLDIHLAHPLKTRAIAAARIKTDKIDSTILAHLLRTNLLPTSYIPARATRDAREILRYRASLVFLRASLSACIAQAGLKNKVHAILGKNGLVARCDEIFSKGGIAWLRSLEVRPCYRQALDGYLNLAEQLNCLIGAVSRQIEQMVKKDPRAVLLTTIPGISYYSALLIISEIGDINRFPTYGHLLSYGGLVPSVHSSGGRTRLGRITKEGSKWLRWILVETGYHAARGAERRDYITE